MEYDFKINEFEGPLDLLLYLIKKSKVDIWDIKIEDIATQYLDYINKMEELNLDIASSYLVMASELIEMKSKMLLPNNRNDSEEEVDEIDPREALINKLIEYQKYKNMVKDFQVLEETRKEVYTKIPDNLNEFKDEGIVNTNNVSLDDLVGALEKFLLRKEESKPLKTNVTTKEISVEERSKSIKRILMKKGKVNFFDLFEVYNKEYIVVTFLAVLEMAKKQELRIVQEGNFDNIMCEVI